MVETAEKISLAFVLISRYAEREGWIPIGWRAFVVGPWSITVNGTSEARDGIPPWHAKVEHRDIVSMMMIHPFGGSTIGWKDTEDDFIKAMERALQPSTDAEPSTLAHTGER